MLKCPKTFVQDCNFGLSQVFRYKMKEGSFSQVGTKRLENVVKTLKFGYFTSLFCKMRATRAARPLKQITSVFIDGLQL